MMQVVLAAAVGAVLVVAGTAKVGDPDGFARTVLAHEVLPWRACLVVGRWLPRVELLVGAALVLGWWTPLSAGVAATLFGAFTGSLLLNRLRGRTELSCGCFGGAAPSRLTWVVVARPALLGATCLVLASQALAPAGALGAGERLVAVAAGVLPVLGVRALGVVRQLTTPAPPGAAPTAPPQRRLEPRPVGPVPVALSPRR